MIEGPENLKQALFNVFKQSKTDVQFASHPHYIYFKQGNQESLIKINPSFDIFHYNLLGRSATEVVKNIILEFIKDHGNQQGRFIDVSRQDMLERNETGFLAGDNDKSRVVLSNEPMTLAYARKRLDQASQVELATKAREHFGLFHSSEQDASPLSPSVSSLTKKPGG